MNGFIGKTNSKYFIPKPRIYGIQRNLTTSSTAWERIEDGVSKVANATHDGSAVVNDFDYIYPWSDIITVDISADGTINSKYGDPNFSFTNPIGHIMTYIPEFWYKRVRDVNNYERIYITGSKKAHYMKSEAFYIGRYDASGASSAITNKSNQTPLVSIGMTDFRTSAKGIGANWGVMDVWRWGIIQMLYLVEYADYDSQGTLGYGICSGTITSSGGCDILGMKSGCTANDKNTPVIYRGIENIFGNVGQYLDGINLRKSLLGTAAFVCRDREQYNSTAVADPYVTYLNGFSSYLPTASGYIYRFDWDNLFPEVQLPDSTVTEIGDAYCPDYYTSFASFETRSIYVGGTNIDDLKCGLWFINTDNATGTSNARGGRVLFIPS